MLTSCPITARLGHRNTDSNPSARARGRAIRHRGAVIPAKARLIRDEIKLNCVIRMVYIGTVENAADDHQDDDFCDDDPD